MEKEKKWRLKIMVDLKRYPRETLDKGLFETVALARQAGGNGIYHIKKYGLSVERELQNTGSFYPTSQIEAFHYTIVGEEVADGV